MGKFILLFFLIPCLIKSCKIEKNDSSPNIILIMTDDQGWGQSGYYNHPVLETPNLDKMAENGIRFDRFYAGSPVCSPTRASVLTGRNNDRTGVYTHGNALRKQEKTISGALKQRGYATGHFGKWHINGLVGPGVPILEDDPYGPGVFGFDEWVSVTNFFDIDPLMSDNGRFKEYEGTSSDIIVDLALGFIGKSIENKKPFFAVIWDGSPHDPFLALETVAHLKGFKGSLWEGGLRVPAIIEWPAKIKPAVTSNRHLPWIYFPELPIC
jgi:arylsulfatase A-like enzyme